jgi:hypothetical protein
MVSATSLYLGPDHILQIRSNRIGEEYQRFYLQDVQSVVVRNTAPFHYVWAGIFIVLALLAARISGDARWPIGILAVGGIFLWLRGPSCEARLRTAVTSERLRSLHRLKTAERVVSLLRERIEGAQGRVVSVPEDYAADTIPKPPPLPSGAIEQSLAPRQRDHLYLFSFLLFEGFLLGIWLQTPYRTLEQAIATATLIEFLALVIVLVRQAQQRVPKLLRRMTYIATARWFLVQTVATGFAYKSVIIDHAKTMLDPFTVVRGTMSHFTFVSLIGTAAAGLWLSFRSFDE